ncbi:hypothetical protein ISN45_At04g034990 [Arabidopsis thaliana x Arabidopsis arenosa]|uniref:Uncharacterized protein n=2 Tax=Arabidopsis TaxID=3701 RepID=A0A8T2EHX8_ARASU|nr:hypothetical protein ISN45_At04g034990 [Arabidopsis thaliana x Arabidopsis arenosa]KAG7622672.1 hypothetical protein ISN44_As04g034480 [Arabidopsis suecica]
MILGELKNETTESCMSFCNHNVGNTKTSSNVGNIGETLKVRERFTFGRCDDWKLNVGQRFRIFKIAIELIGDVKLV